MSQSKVSRIETGKALPSVIDVQQILNALGIDDELAQELLGLARVANVEYQDVRTSVRRGLHHRQRELAALEAGAKHIRYFLPTAVTGLLQTPDYMRSAMNPPLGAAVGDITKTLALKLERQSILYDTTKQFDFLLTESAARWQLCEPAVMAMQLDRLVSISRLPNVNIGVLPLSARVADVPFHTFTIYGAKLVTVELFTGQLVLRDPKDIEHYRDLFDFFTSEATQGSDARELLRGWSEEFMRSRE